MKPQIVALMCVALFGACGESRLPAVTRAQPGAITLPDPDTGACYANDVTPAVIHTVTEQVLLQPEQIDSDGQVSTPAMYRTETRQMIVQERQELRFEALCESQINKVFLANLQRALTARGFYNGPDNGDLNWRTQRAIRLYQIDQGIDSAILSKATAKSLGLIAVGDLGRD